MAWSKIGQQRRNEETEARIESALKRMRGVTSTLLARVKSKTRKNKVHEIRLGQNGAVFCTCEAWKYQHSGTCKHLEEFRQKCVAQEL